MIGEADRRRLLRLLDLDLDDGAQVIASRRDIDLAIADRFDNAAFIDDATFGFDEKNSARLETSATMSPFSTRTTAIRCVAAGPVSVSRKATSSPTSLEPGGVLLVDPKVAVRR